MKLHALIKKLESARYRYLKKYGREPDVWAWDFGVLELTSNISKVHYGVIAPAENSMSFKVKNP